MKEICPVPITFPVIRSEIQEDEIWNFTIIREVPVKEWDVGSVFTVLRNLVSWKMVVIAVTR
jgi:hypothetical protein